MKRCGGIALILLAITGCSSKMNGRSIQDALVIDVRTPREYQSGHIKGALNIPYDTIGDEIAEVAPNKHRKIVLYCRTGRRSGIALNTLRRMGYTNVENAGGYAAFKKSLGQ